MAVGADREVILPSGAFARVRRLTGRDYIVVRASAAGKDIGFLMITKAVTIDGAPVSYEQLLDMDILDVLKLNSEVEQLISGSFK